MDVRKASVGGNDKGVHIDNEVKPHFQPINWENVNDLTGFDARPHRRTRSVWRNGQNAFFDSRVTNSKQSLRIIYHYPKFKRGMGKKKNTLVQQ